MVAKAACAVVVVVVVTVAIGLRRWETVRDVAKRGLRRAVFMLAHWSRPVQSVSAYFHTALSFRIRKKVEMRLMRTHSQRSEHSLH